VVSSTDSHDHIMEFLDQSCYYFFGVAPELYSRGCMDPVSEPLLLRTCSSAENRTQGLWICSQELWLLDHRGGHKSNGNGLHFNDTFSVNKITLKSTAPFNMAPGCVAEVD
jgi:hypothetical protein